MLRIRIIGLACCLYTLFGIVHGADKYTDENRPYEFGFTIDGEQHRHEKKDEKGIIMGEFGFITADGVYHVTVYATDENGRFKILSMKNIRVKPYPTAGVKKGHSLPFPPSENTPIQQGPIEPSKPQQVSKPDTNKKIASPAKSCSHCSLPTTTTKGPQLTDIAVVSRDRETPGSQGPIGSHPILLPHNNPTYQQNNPQLSNPNTQNNVVPQVTNANNYPETGKDTRVNYPQQSNNVNTNNVQQRKDINTYSPTGNNNQNYPQFRNDANQNYPQNENGANPNYPNIGRESQNEYPLQQSDIYKNGGQQEPSFDQPNSGYNAVSNTNSVNLPNIQSALRNPKQYNDISHLIGTNQPPGFETILSSQPDQPISDKPTLVAAQMQIVPKDTDIYKKRPGEQEGLPNGISKDDMTHLLYTFNYTVGFHGHHEEGYTNGAKQGYYYVTGRNGIRTRVDYVADEKGFRPKISQEVLDLLSDDVPKPETEKEERFGLRGYEFKWLYFPADTKKNNNMT